MASGSCLVLSAGRWHSPSQRKDSFSERHHQTRPLCGHGGYQSKNNIPLLPRLNKDTAPTLSEPQHPKCPPLPANTSGCCFLTNDSLALLWSALPRDKIYPGAQSQNYPTSSHQLRTKHHFLKFALKVPNTQSKSFDKSFNTLLLRGPYFSTWGVYKWYTRCIPGGLWLQDID